MVIFVSILVIRQNKVLRIGLLSDTHGWLNPKIIKHFANVDQIWHAGDIGSLEVIEELEEIAPSGLWQC